MTDYRFTMGCDAVAGTIVGRGADGTLYPISHITKAGGDSVWGLSYHDQIGTLGQDTKGGERLYGDLLPSDLLLTEDTIRDLAAERYSIPQRVVLGGVSPEDGIVALDPKAMLTTTPEEDQPVTTTTFDTHPSPDVMVIDFDAETIHQFASHLFLHVRVVMESETFEERVKTSLEWAADRQDHLRSSGFRSGYITYQYDPNTDTSAPTSFPPGTAVLTQDGKVFGHLTETLSMNEDETSEDYGTVTQGFVVGEKAAVSDEVTEVWVRAENSTLTDRSFTYDTTNPNDLAWYPLVSELLLEAGYRRVWPQED